MSGLHILIADDHPLFLAGVRKTLESIAQVQSVEEAANGQEALDRILQEPPPIAIMDIRMPRLSGLQVLRQIREKHLKTLVVLLTMYDDPETFNEAMDLGVNAYVSKESAMEDLVQAVDSVQRGQYYISPILMNLMIQRCVRPAEEKDADPLASLTPSELRVLKLLSDSLTSRQIAEALFISPRTVENHRAHICAKLGINGSHGLLKFALEHKHKL